MDQHKSYETRLGEDWWRHEIPKSLHLYPRYLLAGLSHRSSSLFCQLQCFARLRGVKVEQTRPIVMDTRRGLLPLHTALHSDANLGVQRAI